MSDKIADEAAMEQADIETTPRTQILNRSTWTRKEYYAMSAGVLVLAFMTSFEGNLIYGVQGFVTSKFNASSLISILPTILQIISAALVPFYTKISDVVGRAPAMTFALAFYLLGEIVEGTASSFGQFAGGQIFYGIGTTGVGTLSQVLIADTTTLANRGLMFALYDLPSAANIWIVAEIIDPLTIGTSWHWVYVITSACIIVASIALLTPLWYLQIKANKNAATREQRKSIRWFLHEFDTVGAILITLGLSLTLLPMILASSWEGRWSNPKIIGMLCAGGISLILLAIWEAKFTNRPIMPTRIFTNPTSCASLFILLCITIMAGLSYQYFTIYLTVSRGISFGDAVMLERGYNMAYMLAQILVGLAMKKYSVYRPYVWVGLVIYVIGLGLMIPARLPGSSDFFVVISQVVVGFGAGLANIACQVAMTAAVAHKDVATVIGANQILGSIGAAFGGALSGGLWTNVLPQQLDKYVTGTYDKAMAINNSAYVSTLPKETYDQVVVAYGKTQEMLSIISCCIGVLALAMAFMMKPMNLQAVQDERDLHLPSNPLNGLESDSASETTTYVEEVVIEEKKN